MCNAETALEKHLLLVFYTDVLCPSLGYVTTKCAAKELVLGTAKLTQIFSPGPLVY